LQVEEHALRQCIEAKSKSIKTAKNRYATKYLLQWAETAMLHQGIEQHDQNGERSCSEQDKP
jgi:hypothetical protein